MTDATDRAAAGESARNQMIRDAILQSGGNASDPSLAASMAESLSQRNDASSRAANQLNMRATSDNFNAQRQSDLANQGAKMNQMQFNASNQQQANASNANMQQQMNMVNLAAQNQANQFGAGSANQFALANAGARNKAAQYGAEAANRQGMANQGAQNQAAQFGASATNNAASQNMNAQNQAGMFNANNQMQAQLQNFNAGNQALMYNNNRQQMLSAAENNKIGLLGQQRFTTNSLPQQQFFPSFQQFSQQAQPQQQTYSQPSYQSTPAPSGPTGSVWAGSGKPSVGSGYTTSNFGPTTVGNPWGPGASVGTNQPAVSQGLVAKPGGKPLVGGGRSPYYPVNPAEEW